MSKKIVLHYNKLDNLPRARSKGLANLFTKEDLSWAELKEAVYLFALILVVQLIMLYIRQVYDLQPVPALLPTGYNHWIPETISFFLIGRAARVILSKYLSIILPFLGIIYDALSNPSQTNLGFAIILAIIVFIPFYVAGYFSLRPKIEGKKSYSEKEAK